MRSVRLRGSIGNVVTLALASALKRVVESNPVASLVCQGTTQIRRSMNTSRESRITNDYTIILGVVVVAGREGSVAEEITCVFVIERDGKDIEGVGTAASEFFLHFFLFGGRWGNVLEPFTVPSPGGVDKFERETSSCVVPIQDLDLVLDLLVPGT